MRAWLFILVLSSFFTGSVFAREPGLWRMHAEPIPRSLSPSPGPAERVRLTCQQDEANTDWINRSRVAVAIVAEYFNSQQVLPVRVEKGRSFAQPVVGDEMTAAYAAAARDCNSYKQSLVQLWQRQLIGGQLISLE